MFLVGLAIALFLIGIVTSFPSTTFTQGPELQRFLSSQENFTLEDAYYISGTSHNLDFIPDNKEQLCNMASEGLNKAASFESVFHAVFIGERLGCAKRANQKVASLLLSEKFTSSSMEDLYYATAAAFRLKEKKHLSFDPTHFNFIIDRISDLTARDGTIKNNENDNHGTLYHSGLAFKTVAIIRDGNDDLSSEQEFVIELLQENVEDLLELATETDDGLLFTDNNDSRFGFRVTNTFLSGAYELTEDVDILIDADILDGITEEFLSHCPFNNIENIFHFTNVLSLLTSEDFPEILVVSVPNTSFSGNSKNGGKLVVTITDLQGESIADVKTFLMTASSFNDDSVIYSNQPLEKENDNDFTFNFLTNKPQPGFYSLDIGVQVGSNDIRSTVRTIKVSTSISMSPLKMNVIDSVDRDIIDTQTLNNGKQLSNFKLSYYNSVDISFVLKNQVSNKPIKIQQALLRIAGDKTETSFPLSFRDDTYRASLDMKEVGKDLWFLSGSYQMYLITGDPFIDNSSVLELGTASITFPPSLAIHSNENVYITKPEIEHIFRQPEKRPTETVSTIFSVAVVVPAAIASLLLIVTGIPIKTPSGSGFLFSILFFATICAIFLSYIAFWFNQFNMFQTLQNVLVLGFLSFLFGFKALRAKATQRTAIEGKTKEE